MPTDPDLRDAELRALFHGAAAPTSSIDPAAIIRRSRIRRLPRQLGTGSVLTLAVAGIGVAGFTGLRGLAPMGASETAADAPAGVSEGAPVPWSGADSVLGERAACEDSDDAAGNVTDELTLVLGFPQSAPAGEPVNGTITVTNSGTEVIAAQVSDATVTLSRGESNELYRSASLGVSDVDLAPGESVELAFTFLATSCQSPAEPLEPGRYDLSAVISLMTSDGSMLAVGGQASALTLR